MAVRFYDPDRVVILLAGIRLQGWADGEFLTYKRNRAGMERVVGTDGEVARSRSVDMTGDFTVHLLQTSSSNDALSALHTLDLNAPNGAGVGIFSVADTGGRTLISAQQAWVVQFPDGSMDRSAKERAWMIHTGETIWSQGGN